MRLIEMDTEAILANCKGDTDRMRAEWDIGRYQADFIEAQAQALGGQGQGMVQGED